MDCNCKNSVEELKRKINETKKWTGGSQKNQGENGIILLLIIELHHEEVKKIKCDCFYAKVMNGIYNILHLEHIEKILQKMMLRSEDKKELCKLLPFIEVLANMTEEEAKRIKEKRKEKSGKFVSNKDGGQDLDMTLINQLLTFM